MHPEQVDRWLVEANHLLRQHAPRALDHVRIGGRVNHSDPSQLTVFLSDGNCRFDQQSQVALWAALATVECVPDDRVNLDFLNPFTEAT